jgi:trans-aconitate methyltransferase
MAARRASLFDRWSATYDRPRFQDATYRPVHDAVLARLVSAQPSTVVDLGCGTGHLTSRLVERFPDAHVVGVDYSSGMLAKARVRLGDTAALMQCDAQHLALQGSCADVMVCTESFHWYRDQRQVLSDLAAIIRPGGQLIIASIAAITDVGDSIVHTLSSIGGQPVQAITPSRLKQLLTTAGFDVVQQKRVPRMGLVPWPILTDARRNHV